MGTLGTARESRFERAVMCAVPIMGLLHAEYPIVGELFGLSS